MRRLLPAAAAVAVFTAACGPADAEPSAGVAAPPTTGPADTTSETTGDTTAGSAPDTTAAPIVATRTVVDLEESQDRAWAEHLRPAAHGRGHLLIGGVQAEGQPGRPAIWDSPDGLTWTEAPAPTPPAGQQYALGDAAWVGGQLIAVGSVNDGAGRTAAVWFAGDGRNFAGPPEQLAGTESSRAILVAATDAGPLVVGRLDAGGMPFVAVRDAAGSWQRAAMPDVPFFNARGVAASGSTVVVTGVDAGASPDQARALVSVDGGRTFALADTTILAGGVITQLGAVATVAGGFVAAACAPTPTGSVTALARSADGLTWTRQDVQLAEQDVPTAVDLRYAGCDEISVDGDTVRLGVLDLGSWVLSVTPDGRGTLLPFPRREGHVPIDTPLVITTAAGLVGVGRDNGGFTPAQPETGQIGGGLPEGRPLLTGVAVESLSDTLMVRTALFPQVTELDNGGYGWGPFWHWFESVDGAQATSSLTDAAMISVQQSPFGDLAFGRADDPADAGRSGPNGGTAWFVRGADRIWQPRGLLASGPGGEAVIASVSSASATVAVGRSAVREPTTGATTTRPLVFATTDGQSWAQETIPLDAAAEGWLLDVCALGDRFVAPGRMLLNGVEQTMLAVRDADGTWTVATPVGLPPEQVVDGCAVLGDAVVVSGAATDRPALYTSPDLATFTPVDVSSAEWADTRVLSVEVVGDRLVAGGWQWTPAASDDAALWTSTDGQEWTRLDVEGLGGLGEQEVQSVAAGSGGSVVLAGMDNGAAVLWTLPPDALQS